MFLVFCQLGPRPIRFFQHRLLSHLILGCGSLLIPFLIWASPVVIPVEGAEEYYLEQSAYLLEDQEGQWTIQDVVGLNEASWTPHNSKTVPNFGFTDSAIWVRLQIQNHNPTVQQWLLEIGYSQLDYVHLYLPQADGSFLQKISGDQYPFSQREVIHRNFAFHLPLPLGETVTVYLRFQTESSMQFPLMLWSSERFIAQATQAAHGLGAYYGIMLVMMLYNLFLYLSVRDRSYLFYVLHIGVLALGQMALNGLAKQYLWPDFPTISNGSVVFLSAGIMFTSTLFSIAFLHTRKYSLRLHRLLVVLMGAAVLIMLLSLFTSYSTSIRGAVALAPIWAGLLFLTGFVVWHRGYSPARYYLFAWSAFLIGAVALVLKSNGMLPRNFFTEYSVQIGAALEVVLLSLGLADRINVLKKEKSEAQREIRQRLEALLDVTKKLAAARNPFQVLREASSTIVRECDSAPIATVFLAFRMPHPGQDWKNYRCFQIPPNDIWSATAIDPEKVETKTPTIVQQQLDITTHEGWFNTENALWIFIRPQEGIQGAMVFEGITAHTLPRRDLDFINTLIPSISIALDNMCFQHRLTEKVRMENELKTAAAMQSAFFPKSLPQLPQIEFASYYQSATETGGDWYGFITEVQGAIYILIGDVTGHGVPAALVTAAASSTCRLMSKLYYHRHQLLEEHPTPKELLTHFNQAVFEAGNPDYLMTFFIGQLDLQTGLMTFSNAGHNFPLLIGKEGKIKSLLNQNYRLGDSPHTRFSENTVQLQQDDVLVFYTDGLVENMNPQGEAWGERRFKRYLKRNRNLPMTPLIEKLIHEAYTFYNDQPLADDMTILACQIRGTFRHPMT